MNRVRGTFIVLVLCLALPASAWAGESTYLCTIKQAMDLTDDGRFEKHDGFWNVTIGKTFTVNRTTGEMIGHPFSSRHYLGGVEILNPGSSENSYQALVRSGGPNISVMYIYIKEYHEGTAKPFWGNGDYRTIFSGTCE